jgi:hypothetical protein
MSLIHIENLSKHLKILDRREGQGSAFRFAFTYIIPSEFRDSASALKICHLSLAALVSLALDLFRDVLDLDKGCKLLHGNRI